MLDPNLLFQLTKARERAAVQAAEWERLRQDGAPEMSETPALADRMVLALSDLLIAGGRRLRGWREPAMSVSPHTALAPIARVPFVASPGRPAITLQLIRRGSAETYCLMYWRLNGPRPASGPDITYLTLPMQPNC